MVPIPHPDPKGCCALCSADWKVRKDFRKPENESYNPIIMQIIVQTISNNSSTLKNRKKIL